MDVAGVAPNLAYLIGKCVSWRPSENREGVIVAMLGQKRGSKEAAGANGHEWAITVLYSYEYECTFPCKYPNLQCSPRVPILEIQAQSAGFSARFQGIK